jgi:hypothetical protein
MGSRITGPAASLVIRRIPAILVDEPGGSTKSPDAPGTAVHQSGGSVRNNVEAYADGNSQPTLKSPPARDWPHAVSSREIFGSVREDDNPES